MLGLIFRRHFGRMTFMRHAESEYNRLGIVQGCSKNDLITLSEAGRLSVKSTLSRVIKPTVVVTSDLLRSQQTAEAWFGVAFAHIPVITRIEPTMTEINAGEYEGKALVSLKKDPLWQQWMSNPLKFPGFPGGENLQEFSEKFLKGAASLCDEYGDSQHRVCVITHGVAMRVLKCFLAGESLDQLWSHQVANLERVELTYQQIQRFQALYQEHLSRQTHTNYP